MRALARSPRFANFALKVLSRLSLAVRGPGHRLCPRIMARWEMLLIHHSGLFSRDFYRRANRDVARAGQDPLYHFVRWGAREGRNPNPVFDVGYYRRQLDRFGDIDANPLIHYLAGGGASGRTPSPWFDADYYLATNYDVQRAKVDPYTHFCRHGMNENRAATPLFNPAYYLRANPDVAVSGLCALEHFVLYGEQEGRRPAPPLHTAPDGAGDGGRAGSCSPQVKSSLARIAEHGRRAAPNGEAEVCVVVPVYRGRAETLSCLALILTAENETPFELVVIDDRSPDKALSSDLRRLARKGYFKLLRNRENRGFVASVNRGMAFDTSVDVILLNSDTEVYGDWIDRLRAASRRAGDIGTVTPMTNNGTICSYPVFTQDNVAPLEVSHVTLDRLAREANDGVAVEIPTAVGFCMYITRPCLEACGLFDEQRFGKGYGEENEFCLRSRAQGWRHVLAANVFVRHLGSTSFGNKERLRRGQRALETLNALYPDYERSIQRFIDEDPIREVRARLDVARLKRLGTDRNMLLVNHVRGGGTEKHVQEQIARLTREGWSTYHLRATPFSRRLARLSHAATLVLPNMDEIDLEDEPERLVSLLRSLGISRIHIHHLVEFKADAPDRFADLSRKAGIPIDVTVHDYFSICPRINLVGADGTYCGEPPVRQCQACLSRRPTEFGAVDVAQWRARYARLFEVAEHVYVPNGDVETRLRRYFPSASIVVRAHDDADSAFEPRVRSGRKPSDPVRVGVIGAISDIKGLRVLEDCARLANRKGLPVSFTVIGYTSRDAEVRRLGVEVTGPYSNDKVEWLVAKHKIDVLWLPSIWPETYCYTLSEALQTGLPICAFDIGAIAARLRALDAGRLIDLDEQGNPAFIVGELMALGRGAPVEMPGSATLALSASSQASARVAL